MSWYRCYIEESALYGPHDCTRPGRTVSAINKQQQYTAVDREHALLEDAEQQHDSSEAREDETFFSFRAFVSNRATQYVSQTANATQAIACGTQPCSTCSTGAASSSDASSSRPQVSSENDLSCTTTVSSVREAMQSLQQSQAPSSPAANRAINTLQLPQSSAVHKEKRPNERVTHVRPKASATSVQVKPQLLSSCTAAAAAAGSAGRLGSYPASPVSGSDAAAIPVEVEMQHRAGVRQRRVSSASPPGERVTDPLLHWTECWAGAGLRHKAAAAGWQQSHSSSTHRAGSSGCAEAGPPTHCQQQQQQAPHPPQSPLSTAGGRWAAAPHAAQHPVSPATPQQQSSNTQTTRLVQQQQQQQQQRQVQLLSRRSGSQLRWWLLGGVGIAALSGCAVIAVYGVMSYMMKAAMVYSLAWKAATGVAAAEGLALGGWSVRSARANKAASAAAAEELSRVRDRAVRELNALRAMLQQQGAAHGQEVSQLTKVNEKLRRLAHTLTTENASLQTALQQAAAERKALEAAAAIENSRAQTSAVAAVAAAQGERVLGEVEVLSAQQQQLMALVFELREDLLGLVAAGDKQAATELIVESTELTSGSSLAFDQTETVRQSVSNEEPLLDAAVAATAAPAGEEDRGISTAADGQVSIYSACCSASLGTGVRISNDSNTAVTAASEGPAPAAADTAETSLKSAKSGSSVCSQVQHIKSVRGGVDAAMAAAVAHTLEL